MSILTERFRTLSTLSHPKNRSKEEAGPSQENPAELKKSTSKNENSAAATEPSNHCDCGPDLYTRVLGPTADEAILSGLQMFFDFCDRFRAPCEAEAEKKNEDDDNKEKESFDDKATAAIDTDLHPDVASSTVQTRPDTKSNGFQVAPKVNSQPIQSMPPTMVQSGIAQTSNPEMISQILQTLGLPPDSASKLIQKSLSKELRSIGTASSLMLTADAGCMIMAPHDQDDENKDKSDKSDKGDKDSKDKSDSHADEHACISPAEPPKICKCCKCAIDKKKDTDNKEKIKGKPAVSCSCHRKVKGKCSCLRQASTSNRKLSASGDSKAPLEVRYAVTRISKYDDFTTYEILKSTSNEPRKMPKCVEGIFVLRKKKKPSS